MTLQNSQRDCLTCIHVDERPYAFPCNGCVDWSRWRADAVTDAAPAPSTRGCDGCVHNVVHGTDDPEPPCRCCIGGAFWSAGVTKKDVLDKAVAAVADRGLSYGKPEDNFERVAARWRAHLKNRFGLDVAIDGASVAVMMADVKLARLENQPAHLDSWVDLAGYAACGGELTKAR